MECLPILTTKNINLKGKHYTSQLMSVNSQTFMNMDLPSGHISWLGRFLEAGARAWGPGPAGVCGVPGCACATCSIGV